MKAPLAAFILLALAAAGRADNYEVTSDTMTLAEGVFRFAGAVRIDSADLKLEADELVYDENDRSYRASGRPASIELLDADGAATTATGPSITYDSQTRRLALDRGGRLERLGMKVAAESAIAIDIVRNRMDADGGVRIQDGDIDARGATATATGQAGSLVLQVAGAPASFELADAERQNLQASSKRIEYNESQGKLVLEGEAQANLGTEFLTGDRIEYDLNAQTFAAAPTEGGRVRAVIQAP